MAQHAGTVLSAINVYPVKSLRGISLSQANVEPHGLQYDRMWMLLNESGEKMTQREYPQMATVATAIASNGIEVSAAGKGTFLIPFKTPAESFSWVDIWGRNAKAVPVSKAADEWFTRALGVRCTLTVSPERQPGRAQDGELRFHDGCAFLVVGEASLADLNRRMEKPVPMNRFRPSFVVSGSPPFAEDAWKSIAIGETQLLSVRKCDRCVITTTDQETGTRYGPDPLKTLATFRRADQQIFFGQYFKAAKVGSISVGDAVYTA